MSEFFLDKKTSVLLEEHDRLFKAILNQFSKTRKTDLIQLLEIERELGAREERT